MNPLLSARAGNSIFFLKKKFFFQPVLECKHVNIPRKQMTWTAQHRVPRVKLIHQKQIYYAWKATDGSNYTYYRPHEMNLAQASGHAVPQHKSVFMLTHKPHQYKFVLMMQSIKQAFSAYELCSARL